MNQAPGWLHALVALVTLTAAGVWSASAWLAWVDWRSQRRYCGKHARKSVWRV